MSVAAAAAVALFTMPYCGSEFMRPEVNSGVIYTRCSIYRINYPSHQKVKEVLKMIRQTRPDHTTTHALTKTMGAIPNLSVRSKI